MDGLEIKARIVKAGIRTWDVARESGIHPSRLSGILNNRLDPNRGELDRIFCVIDREEKKTREWKGLKNEHSQ